VNNDKTCEACPERRRAIVLAYEDFSPETPQWLCALCFDGHEDHMTIIEYANADDAFNARQQSSYMDLTGFQQDANGTYWVAAPGYRKIFHAHCKRVSRRRVCVYQKRAI
jgi:hypothetical protein